MVHIFTTRRQWVNTEIPVSGTGIRTCCTTVQLQAMDEKLQLAEGILKRCTSCVKNLMKHICEFTCSVNQSKFIEPAELLQNERNGNVPHNTVKIFDECAARTRKRRHRRSDRALRKGRVAVTSTKYLYCILQTLPTDHSF